MNPQIRTKNKLFGTSEDLKLEKSHFVSLYHLDHFSQQFGKNMSKAAGNAEGPPVSKRPKGDAFRQQKMTAWQPLMTPLKVVVVFLAIGVAFIPTGVTLMQKSADIFDKSIIYDGNGAEVDCGITKPNAGKTCSVR